MNEKQSQLPINDITGTSFERVVYSIGHSNKSLAELKSKLVEYGIDRLIDVRTKPYSRWHPQFNRDMLAISLYLSDINYDWRGLNLGGLQENVDYDETIRWICERAGSENIALMCSEADYTKCHRHTMLEPDFNNQNVEMVHIRYAA